MKKTVLILTKSAKTGGYCVAGIDVNTRQWIRLVTDNEEVHHSLTDENMVCSNGRVCDKLDVVEVDFIGNAPLPISPKISSLIRLYRSVICTAMKILSRHSVT